MKLTINDIAYQMGSNKLDYEGVLSRHPDWDAAQLEAMVGINDLFYVNKDETSLDLGYNACLKLFEEYPELPDVIDGLIFCTVTADHMVPQNSFILHNRLKLRKEIFALDLGMACSGFVYSLAVAHGLIHSGICKNILIITAETYSKFVNDNDRSVRTVFSDGAAVTWVSGSESSSGLLDIDYGAMGSAHDAAWIPAGQCRVPYSLETAVEKTDQDGSTRSLEQIYMDGRRLFPLVSALVPKQIQTLLDRNRLDISDIDLFIFHQASKITLDFLESRLKIPAEKHFRNLAAVGNTSSSTIPIAIKDAMDSDRLNTGDKIVISGFGAGFSWGSAILEM